MKSLCCNLVPRSEGDPGSEVACVVGKLHITSATAVNKTFPPVVLFGNCSYGKEKINLVRDKPGREFVQVRFR